ncbi:MAG: poly(A) polymerase [Candidatus Aminicenantes bacterium]|nr:poly(A) polymerase [Candidatus Aminicenantes bacterium]
MDDSQSVPDRPVIVTKPGHSISRQDIDPNALKVVFRLQRLGFTAYVTGGAVRDLLLRRPAKDFDVVTNARPGQIKKRFANAYVIGRRFRLVHVHFGGGGIIEVATFRRAVERSEESGPEDESPPPSPYGTPEEDAFRRDITINALFYDVINDAVVDYVGGLEDLARKIVRVIGDPAERFSEDPVRIWRVLRHAARLGFSVEESAGREISVNAHLIAACPGARLYEELNRDLASETKPVLTALRESRILRHIFGKAGEAYEIDDRLFSELSSILEAVDRAKTAGVPLSLGEMYAALFWPWAKPLFEESGVDFHKILNDTLRDSGMRINIPRALRADFSQILIIAAAMERALHTGKMRWSLARRPLFGEAARLHFLIFKGRPPEKEESFETLFRQAFPGGGSERRRRRRRPRRRRQDQGQPF